MGYVILALFGCGAVFVFLSVLSVLKLAHEHTKWKEAFENTKKKGVK